MTDRKAPAHAATAHTCGLSCRRPVHQLRRGVRLTAHVLTAHVALHTGWYAIEPLFHVVNYSPSALGHALAATPVLGVPAAAGTVVGLHLLARRLEES